MGVEFLLKAAKLQGKNKAGSSGGPRDTNIRK